MTSILERLQAALGDHYAIERELGRGGMATVYLAKDRKHDRAVAIKVLHPDLAATIGADRFEREIRLAAKLQHAHILGLYDSGERDSLLYYVMPFVEGESLRDRLDREGPLPIDDAVGIILEVADALGYAHQHGIVHRDIKPENVLISGGHAVVADFGIAKAVSEGGGQKLTQTGMAVGTPVYMAPEQTAGDPVGPPADIYSLGCMLYELLAGEPPFTAKTAMALMARHAMESVPSIRIVRNTVSEEVEDAIFAAMAKLPADRPQSAAQFAELLGAQIGTTTSRRASIRATATRRVPTQAIPIAPPTPWWKRRSTLAATMVAIGAIGAFTAWRLGAAGATVPSRLGADARRVAVLYFEDRSQDGQLRDVADGLTEALIRKLGEIPTLSVVSRNGVSPFRGTEIQPDSISKALKAGTLINGSIDLVGSDRVRISTELLDHGTPVGKRNSIELSRDQLAAAEDSVAVVVAGVLRELIGDEVRLKEGQARTRSLAAWTLVNRAEKIRKDAEAAAAGDRERAGTLLSEADSLLALAAGEDSRWADPLVQRGEAAYQHARLLQDPAGRDRWLATADSAAAEALRRDPTSAAARALRGTLSFGKWRINRTADQVTRAALLDSARADLEAATRDDPTLAAAFAQLSFVYYSDKSVPVSFALDAARKAYQADAFLRNADVILDRLFWSSYDTNQFADATNWCDEGRRRFPDAPGFTECSLWLLLAPNTTPDIALAWRIKAKLDSLSPPAERPFRTRLSQLIVGGVIARAAKANPALADSADRVLIAGRGDKQVDPADELVGYEAVMRAQGGDADKAIARLRLYVAVNPDHSFKVGDNVHWWWQGLQNHPEFKALLSGH